MKSIIGIWYEAGIEYLTLENGGELDKAGRTLALNYVSTGWVEELIERGNIKELGNEPYECKGDYTGKKVDNPTADSIPELLDKAGKEKAFICYVWNTDDEDLGWRAYSNIILPETADLLGETDGVKLDTLLFKTPEEKKEEQQRILRDRYDVHCWKDFLDRCDGFVPVNIEDEQWDWMEMVQSGKDNEDDDEEEYPEVLSYIIINDETFAKCCTTVPLWYHSSLECYVVGKTFCGTSWEDEGTCPNLCFWDMD